MIFAQNAQQSDTFAARLPFGSTNKNVKLLYMCYAIYREILFQKVALGYLLHFVQNGSSTYILKHTYLHNNLTPSEKYTAQLPFGSTTKRKIVTQHMLYKIYREILFQEVALGY